jgi:hypothetical protein
LWDVYSDPEAKKEWEALGLETLPCVVQGRRHVLILHTDQLRTFLGLKASAALASYQALVGAMKRILTAVEQAVRQVPSERLADPTPNRGRDLREMVFNIHERIPPMTESLDSGTYAWKHGDDFSRSRHFRTSEELGGYCAEVRTAWFKRAAQVDDDAAYEMVQTRRGPVTHLQLLESQAFHAAQHLRQIYLFMGEIGITPTRPLTAAEMAPIVLGEQVY